MSLFSENDKNKKREYARYRQTAARFRYFPRSSYKYNLIQQQWYINSSNVLKLLDRFYLFYSEKQQAMI